MPSLRSMKNAGIIERPISNRAVNDQIDPTIEEVGQEVERENLMSNTLLSRFLITTVGGTGLGGIRNHGPEEECSQLAYLRARRGRKKCTLMVLASSSRPSFLSVRNS